MKSSKLSVAGALVAMVAAAGSGNAQSTKPADRTDSPQAASAKSQGASGAAAPSRNGSGEPLIGAVLVLLPVAQAADDKLANGCWVRFYDGKNYRGANLTLAGPVDMPRMDVPGALWRDWDSAIVGPKARVTTYDNENFKQRTATLNAGQRIADLGDKKLGWFDEVHSARVSCTG